MGRFLPRGAAVRKRREFANRPIGNGGQRLSQRGRSRALPVLRAWFFHDWTHVLPECFCFSLLIAGPGGASRPGEPTGNVDTRKGRLGGDASPHHGRILKRNRDVVKEMSIKSFACDHMASGKGRNGSHGVPAPPRCSAFCRGVWRLLADG